MNTRELPLGQAVTAKRRSVSRAGNQTLLSRTACSVIEPLEARLLLSAAIIEHPSFVLRTPTTTARPAASAGFVGLSPTQLRQAYGFNQVSFSGVTGNGTGQTIAIVDAYNDPDIVTDLQTFDAQYGLANPTLTQINESGGTSLPGTDPSGKGNSWAIEISLDVEWAHVAAPGANIVLVEASSDSTNDLFAAVNTARNYAGVSVVSMSWGGSSTAGQSAYDSYFTTPAGHIGVTFLAASGDSGSYDPTTGSVSTSYPAASPNVIGVGGTTLQTDSSGDYLSETAWGNGTRSKTQGGSGGGLSPYDAQPAYQNGIVTQSSTERAVPDVSIDANPSTGVGVVDSWDFGSASPWVQVGGTSLATPLWAGLIAVVDQGIVAAGGQTLDGATQTLPKLYALPASDFHDITSGSNGAYSAGTGYDLVTGRGSPIVNSIVAGLVTTQPTPPTPTPTPTPTVPTIGGLNVSPGTVTIGNAATLTATKVAETGGTISQVAFYRELKPSQGAQPIVDYFIGYGTQSGTSWTVSYNTTGLTAGTYIVYAIATDSTGTSSAPVAASLTVQAKSTPTPTPTPPPTTPTAPTIQAVQVNPSTPIVGTSVFITASGVQSGSSRITQVTFYRELNSTLGPQPTTDHVIGNGYREGASWFIFASTSSIAPGTYTIYAIATNAAGLTSTPVTTTVTVVARTAETPPTIGALTSSATSVTAGQSFTLTASNVTASSGKISYVSFYLESDPTTGPNPSTDSLIGYGYKQRGTNNWTLAIGTRMVPAGTYTIYAVATDSQSNSSAPVAITITITARTPSPLDYNW
jgi:subtilase family serine protease